jgi:hypothetical protein
LVLKEGSRIKHGRKEFFILTLEFRTATLQPLEKSKHAVIEVPIFILKLESKEG